MYISCVIKGVKQIIGSYSNTTRCEMKPWALFSPRADNIAIKGISSEERRVGFCMKRLHAGCCFMQYSDLV